MRMINYYHVRHPLSYCLGKISCGIRAIKRPIEKRRHPERYMPFEYNSETPFFSPEEVKILRKQSEAVLLTRNPYFDKIEAKRKES